MKTQKVNTSEQQNVIPTAETTLQSKEATATFADNRSGSFIQRKMRKGIENSPRNQATAQLQKGMQKSTIDSAAPLQQKTNPTGLPDSLKSGIENLSGYAMDDVKVHYNSSKPAQLQAHAYAQGSEIHVGPGQEKHLGHEAWHVVQQKQGRVKPTTQLKGKVNINDDAGLEKEADIMGAKAQMGPPVQRMALSEAGAQGQTVQMERFEDLVEQYDHDQQVPGRVLIIEVNLAGSHNQHLAPKDKERNEAWIDVRADKKIAHSRMPSEDRGRYHRKQIEFEGPGAKRTRGAKSYLGGLMDGGTNGTVNLKKLVPGYVENLVNTAPAEQWKKVVVLVAGHSRGAVAAYHVSHKIKHDHPEWHVELTQFDPVPGPLQKKKNKEGRRGDEAFPLDYRDSPLNGHTVIYSVASGVYGIFTPMLLHSMRRLIITSERHSAGVGEVFAYGNREFVRSELNALTQGIYVESDVADNRGRILLRQASSTDEAKAWYQEILDSSKYKSDKGRKKIIHTAIDTFLY